MRLAPVVLISHAGGPAGWTGALESLAGALDRHPSLAVAVRAPGAALEYLARDRPGRWESLPRDRIEWLAGGYTDPILPSLPSDAASLQLERETVAMEAAGVTPTGLWVGDAWEPGIVDLARRYSLSLVFLDASLLDPVPDRPGPVERAGEAVLAVPVLSSAPTRGSDDGLAAVLVEAAELAAWAEAHRTSLDTPDSYLTRHLPGRKLAPAVTGPLRHACREAFYRELLMLTRDQGDRRPGREALLRLQSREYLVDCAGSDAELLEARRALDRTRHRGESWVDMRDLDWDADGLEEDWIGTPEYTVVVGTASGTLELWADRTGGWALTVVDPPLPGLLMRRLGSDGDEPPMPRLTVEGRSQGKNHASLTLAEPDEGRCHVEVVGRTLSIDLSVPPQDGVRIGPEIPVGLAETRLRADGGEWIEVGEPVAVSGHRFRLTDGERTLLVSSPRPCEMFVRPLAGRGIVVWPHWMTRQGGSYRVALTPS